MTTVVRYKIAADLSAEEFSRLEAAVSCDSDLLDKVIGSNPSLGRYSIADPER